MVNNITKLLKDTWEATDKVNKEINKLLASKKVSKSKFKSEKKLFMPKKVQLLRSSMFAASNNNIKDIIEGINHLNTILKIEK